MKDFFAELLEMLSTCILIVCLSFAAFLLILNFYHYKDITHTEVFEEGSRTQYNEYKRMLSKVDKKMNKVNHNNVNYSTTAKPIYEYYKNCVESLNSGTFAKLDEKNSITAQDIYNSNDDILKNYNNLCIFYIPYNITVIHNNYKLSVPFNSVFKNTEAKRKIVIDNATYLTKSGLGNSSYSFTTEVSRNSIYNKNINEFRLTINNYKLMASILDDVAKWYVAEFGGNS